MAWIYFQVVEDSPKDLSNGSRPSLTVKSTQELSACCCPEWDVVSYQPHLSGMTCLLCGGLTCPAWISSRAGSHARTSALQAMERDWTASEADLYLNTSASLASADPDSSSWRTSQLSLFGGLTEFSWDSMRWGMMRDGQLFQPQKWAPRTSENESGYLPTPVTVDSGSYFNKSASAGAANRPTLGAMAKHNLWPTPTANDGKNDGKNDGGPSQLLRKSPALNVLVKLWQTPTASDYRSPNTNPGKSGQKVMPSSEHSLPARVGGQLNPTFVEWLMAWSIGSTVCESWVMEFYLSARKRRSNVSEVS